MQRISILGVPVDVLTQCDAVAEIQRLLASDSQHQVATPNPEMLVEARRNAAFHAVLQSTALNLPDGAGLLWAARMRGQRLPERVTGTDTMLALCALQDAPSVFLLGAQEGVAQRAATTLKERHPSLHITGTLAASPLQTDEEAIVAAVNSAKPSLLFVAYGAPAQELWIARNLLKMPSVRVAMGVGGAFDFIAGTRRRAPECMRKIGLEWVWRFAQEPKRFWRILNAVVVFPAMTLLDRRA